MPAFKDITGSKFGKLTAVERVSGKIWSFSCDCGRVVKLRRDHVVSGATKSCGCIYNSEEYKAKKAAQATTHGLSKHPLYLTWTSMIARCYSDKHDQYKDYGGRGIKVCERWKSFKSFIEDMGIRPEGCTLDRINNDEDYSKENCKWSTKFEQANNSRKNRFLTYKGETKTIADWSRASGIAYKILWSRINNGWSIEKALEEE